MDIYFPVRRKRIRKNSYPWIDSSVLVFMHNRAGHFLRIRQWGGGGASTNRDHTIPSVEN